MEQYYLRQLLEFYQIFCPVALQLDNPFRSLITLLTETNLKRSNLDLAGLTNSLNEVLESSMELARLGPILVKYSLKSLAISCMEVILKPSIFSSFMVVSLEDRPNKSLIVFHASLRFLFCWAVLLR